MIICLSYDLSERLRLIYIFLARKYLINALN